MFWLLRGVLILASGFNMFDHCCESISILQKIGILKINFSAECRLCLLSQRVDDLWYLCHNVNRDDEFIFFRVA